MQEKVLSKKALIFTDQQAYWSCWGAIWLEETALENISGARFLRNPLSKDWSKISFTSVENGYYSLYDELVESYLRRQLSFESDILNAFSGITQVLSSIRNDSFHWGLPESRFDRYLGWKMYGGSKRNNAMCPVYMRGQPTECVRFPSWSWTAWFGGGQSFIGWEGSTERLQGEPEIIFYKRDIKGVLSMITDRTERIKQAPTQEERWLEEKISDIRTQWKGHPRTISKALATGFNDFIDTSYLYFWTSTAELYIHRTGLDSPFGPYYSIIWDHQINERPTEIYIESSSHLQFRDPKIMENLPKHVLKRIEADNTSDILVKEFAVIGRSMRHGDPIKAHLLSNLTTLVIEWEGQPGQVAHRIGVSSVRELDWVHLQNREWKRVVLR
ncbi:hypothetical protein G7Y89_g8158 [Cudoniella acicularis]|uniref:Uncharacterized protein n=1 Tax=Cudoniella acicularis TaxID=354080 RepID=A0A8H4RIN5_9HELO|nr:hypothetical protein G7Y89_g8158 [Cudoniella acicularis]